MIRFYIDRPQRIQADEFELRAVFQIANVRRELTVMTIRRVEVEQLAEACKEALKRFT